MGNRASGSFIKQQ